MVTWWALLPRHVSATNCFRQGQSDSDTLARSLWLPCMQPASQRPFTLPVLLTVTLLIA